MIEEEYKRRLLGNVLNESLVGFLESEKLRFVNESSRLEHLTALLRNMLSQLKQLGVTRVAFDSIRINATQVIVLQGESSKVIYCTLDEAAELPINCLVLAGLSLVPFTQTEPDPQSWPVVGAER